MKSTNNDALSRFRAAAGLRTVSRHKVVETLKTLIYVIPLTLLIWIYAEREQAATDEIRDIEISFAPADAGLTATVIEPANATINIGLFGPRGQIDQLKTRIESEAQGHRLTLTLPSGDASIGERSIDLVRLLNDDPVVASSGVTVMKETTSPLQMKVAIDQLVTRDTAVVKPRELSQGLEHITFDPPRVSFRGPAAAMTGLFPTDGATVAVDLTGVTNQLTVGKHTVEVPLVVPHDPRIIASASRVKMSFDLPSLEDTATARTVRIDVRRPVGQDGRSKVVMKSNLLTNVRIHGPQSEIKRYIGDNPEQLLTAVLSVTAADVGGTGLRRAVTFPDLPPNVTVVDGPYDVDFDVKDIKDVPDADR